MNKEIILIAEHQQGKIDPASYELIAMAMEMRRSHSYPISLIILGKDIRDMSESIAKETGLDVTGIEASGLELYNAEAYISILQDFLSQRNAKYILIPHSAAGFDYAPALAAKIGASCITGVEGCSHEDDGINFIRSIFNGKLKVNITPDTETSVITILPGAFKTPDFNKKRSSFNYEIINSGFSPQRSKTHGIIQTTDDDYPLADADVIVSAGRGIGKEENLELIRHLAGIFPRSAIGASRSVCDLGWLDYRHQVGTTGKTVAPKLYIACGISGTVQHISGIRGANMVIAINSDPRAAIFNVSDYCVVEDLTSFIPILVDEYNKRKLS